MAQVDMPTRLERVRKAIADLETDLSARVAREYSNLEKTTEPSPGKPEAQHDAMVQEGNNGPTGN